MMKNTRWRISFGFEERKREVVEGLKGERVDILGQVGHFQGLRKREKREKNVLEKGEENKEKTKEKRKKEQCFQLEESISLKEKGILAFKHI